jgi:hypothetical protein
MVGKRGRAMREARVGGEQDPAARASRMARGRLRAKLPALRQALEGRVCSGPQGPLRGLFAPSALLEGALADLPRASEARLEPFAEAGALAQTLPGGGPTAAMARIAALGTARSRFPSAGHRASWAGAVPARTSVGASV